MTTAPDRSPTSRCRPSRRSARNRRRSRPCRSWTTRWRCARGGGADGLGVIHEIGNGGRPLEGGDARPALPVPPVRLSQPLVKRAPATGRYRVERQVADADSPFLGRDLDEVAAGVVEHRRRDRAHVGRGLREPHPTLDQTLVLGRDVVDGMPSSTSARLNGRAAGCSSGSSESSVPSGASGDTTVSQACSPSGISRFVTKPSTSV